MITVIDYQSGNLRSIYNAFKAFGAQVKISQHPEDLVEADLIVLPGVGAFEDGMHKLKQLNLIEALTQQVIENRKPYLGICLGMQFLAAMSFEHGETTGFGWIPGTVKRIEPCEKSFKVPHIGWNDISVCKDDLLFKGLGNNPVFYFVHSYHLVVDGNAQQYVTSTCWHGVGVTSSVRKDNIFGVQFHPEKSQGAGLKVLQNLLIEVGEI